MTKFDYIIYDEYYSDFTKCKIKISAKRSLPCVMVVGHMGSKLIISTGHYS